MNSRRLRSRKIISLVEENVSTKGFTTAQKRKSQVSTKSVQAMDHEINEEDTTLLTSTPASAHASVPSSSTDNSLIFANITNISDCNTSVLNKNMDYTVDPSISTNISHVSYSNASLLPDNQENSNPCISSNVSHISDSYEFISTKKLESVPLNENDYNNYSQSMDKRKSSSYFNVSLNDLPDSQMHSFSKLSDILNVSDMLKSSPLINKSTSFENNFLLDSRNEISDIRTYASNVPVIDVPPSVAVKPSAILNHASHLNPENVEITSTYLISTVKPPSVATEPLAILDSVSPPNPENIEKKSTYPLSADNFEPLSVVTEPPAISDSASRIDDENIEKNSNYEPSSHESSSESDQELLMENECLDGLCNFPSSYCYNTSPAEKDNVSLREDFVGIDSEEKSEENFNENVDTEKEVQKRIRERDYCFYCESLILNFARHVIRNHSNEPEVQKALSMPKNSKSRKEVLTLLRKKGNYIMNTQNSTFKPMKKNKYNRNDDYLPCTKCLGFYSRKQLWKHKKLCDIKNLISNVQVDAQNFLLRNIKVNQKLKDDVFPRMRPDKISMFAKKDPLICAFGFQYLKSHREKHFINVTSRKMRELGKLLIEIKKIKPNISTLLSALKPVNYGTLVLATKNAASFNNSKDRYDSPTYAMNIATSLKQCCNIALLESYKAEAGINATEVQTDLKTLTSIIQSNWKFDVSSQAADDLNMKRYNKTTIVPLASDLKCLKDHLNKTAAHAVVKLTESNISLNCNAFNELLESVFCRILLLNRRRPGELQRLQLSFYENYDKKDSGNNKYEEFDKVLSATEKILVNSLKRIVIRGKRGRGVPVLFSTDVQKDIETLISIRHKYVNADNDFLFSKAGGSIICGYKTIEKYAKACGAKNPKSLTSTRLRKHLATLTQLFNMSENDMEQLASFMGHTMSIHNKNYRLPDDVFQTAKISKLLLLMETGNADMYKGRTLDEININLEEEIIGDDIQNEEILDFEMLEPTPPVNETSLNPIECSKQSTPSCSSTLIEQKVIKKKRVLVPWTPQQKRVVLNFFSKHIKSRKPPKRDECEKLRSQYPELLNNKDWLKIKVFIQNTYSKQ